MRSTGTVWSTGCQLEVRNSNTEEMKRHTVRTQNIKGAQVKLKNVFKKNTTSAELRFRTFWNLNKVSEFASSQELQTS